MVALARYLVLDTKGMEDWRLLAVTGSILLLTLAVLAVRYGHVRFPYSGTETAPKRTDTPKTDL
jgi:protein PsiE